MSVDVEVIIIGDGAAGMAAAKTIFRFNELVDKGLLPGKEKIAFNVIEAKKNAGGRARSKNINLEGYGETIVADLGPQWFHRPIAANSLENPLVSVARRYGMEIIDDNMPRIFTERGQIKNYQRNIQLLTKLRQRISDYRGPDVSLLEFAGGSSSVFESTFGPPENGVDNIGEVGTHEMRDQVPCNMGALVRGGKGNFFLMFGAEIEPYVKFNEPVRRINIKDNGVMVNAANDYFAEHVIPTFSVGVYKSGMVEFDPPLPAQHQNAIEHLHMGNFNKIFIFFDKKLDVNQNTHIDIRSKAGHDIFCLARVNGWPMITAFMGGRLAILCDRDPGRARNIVIDALSEIWGNGIRDHIIPDPDFEHITAWGNDEFVRGGYSRPDIGHRQARFAFAETIGGRIHPAGEAFGAFDPVTNLDWHTHTYGAVSSGKRAAAKVIEQLRGVDINKDYATHFDIADAISQIERSKMGVTGRY